MNTKVFHLGILEEICISRNTKKSSMPQSLQRETLWSEKQGTSYKGLVKLCEKENLSTVIQACHAEKRKKQCRQSEERASGCVLLKSSWFIQWYKPKTKSAKVQATKSNGAITEGSGADEIDFWDTVTQLLKHQKNKWKWNKYLNRACMQACH